MRSFSPILRLFLLLISSIFLSISISLVTYGTVVVASTATTTSTIIESETDADADADVDVDVGDDEYDDDVASDETVSDNDNDDLMMEEKEEEEEVVEEESVDVGAGEEDVAVDEINTDKEVEEVEVAAEEEVVEEVADDGEEHEEEVLDLDLEIEDDISETQETTATDENEEEILETQDTIASNDEETEQEQEQEVVEEEKSTTSTVPEPEEMEVKQTGPFINLLGETLVSLEMIDDSHAQMRSQLTNDALKGKKVVGLYFSADWCGPCRQFTPELVSFYEKMNSRRGKEGEFEIVWISRCRDFNAFGQYFTHMPWLAMQPELAMGEGGNALSDKYKVKGIPTLVLLDEDGNVITTEARNKVPADRAGIGFPWRNPVASLYINLVPKPLRLMIKSSWRGMSQKVVLTLKGALGLKVPVAQAS